MAQFGSHEPTSKVPMWEQARRQKSRTMLSYYYDERIFTMNRIMEDFKRRQRIKASYSAELYSLLAIHPGKRTPGQKERIRELKMLMKLYNEE